jgi:hypothetical protein
VFRQSPETRRPYHWIGSGSEEKGNRLMKIAGRAGFRKRSLTGVFGISTLR